jgi:hypothetical protein
MNLLARPLTLISVLLISIGLATSATRASEEPPVVRALLDSVAISTGRAGLLDSDTISADARPSYSSLDVSADGTVTLRDLEVKFQDEGGETVMTYKIASLILADVNEISTGLFEVGAVEWSEMTVTADGNPVAAIPTMTGESVYIHQPGEEPTALERIRASNIPAKAYLIPEALIVFGGQSVVLEDLNTSWQGDPMTGAGTTRFIARRIHFPGAMFDNDNPVAMTGYEELEFAFSGTTTSTYTDEVLGFDIELRLDGRDIGSLIIDFGADGIPLALFDTVVPDPDQLLPFAEGVSLKRAKIRFEDDSLTGRVLSLMAEAEGMEVDMLVAELTEDIEMILEEFLDHALAQQVSTSLAAYLNDPKAITFAMAPKLPVGFDQIMAELEDPLALIELLQVSISAND